jgi:MSHA pilin protein MshB
MRPQSGFTIIELVVVIILLGILAATALPRFMNVDDQAHDSVVSGVMGSLQTGISLYHAQWVAEGRPDPDTALAPFGGLLVNEDGYPYGTVVNGGSDVSTSADCLAIFTGLLQAGHPTLATATDLAGVATAAGSNPRSDFVAVGSAGSCTYHYTAATVRSGAEIPTLVYSSASGQLVRATATLP